MRISAPTTADAGTNEVRMDTGTTDTSMGQGGGTLITLAPTRTPTRTPSLMCTVCTCVGGAHRTRTRHHRGHGMREGKFKPFGGLFAGGGMMDSVIISVDMDMPTVLEAVLGAEVDMVDVVALILAGGIMFKLKVRRVAFFLRGYEFN